MKGLFIPDITAEMFRNTCLEGIEALMAEGEIYDVDYEPEHPLLKIIQDFKEATGCKDILVIQKDAMKAWDENGVEYTMQPERKTGEWVAYGDIPKECPFCGEDWDKYVFGDVAYTGDLPKFCPNCGRMMKEKENG